ncbi:MAG TPA: MoaD family protein [Nitrososphaerales archaeon]|nr:MoaD family protein [Nitrososphaerales archaeon]
MIRVHVSGHLKDYTGRKRDFEMPYSNNVGELVGQLNKMFPGIKERIFDDQDKTRPYVNIFVNGENLRDIGNEGTTLKDGAIVNILPSVAGGLN